MRPDPYIGITGFSRRKEVEEVLRTVPRECSRKVMVGVLVSPKTLACEPHSRPRRYPPLRALGDIFTIHRNAFNLLHFNTKHPESFADDLVSLQYAAGHFCHGFQLNIPWPHPHEIERYKNRAPGRATIVLQLGRTALAPVLGNGPGLAAAVSIYKDLVDYVLIDPSGAEGIAYDLPSILRCLDALQSIDSIGIGIAGGFSADNVRERIKALAERGHTDYSIDTEARVRTPDDDLDIAQAARFLGNAITAFQEAGH